MPFRYVKDRFLEESEGEVEMGVFFGFWKCV